jgi:hypothetical protein
MRIPVLVILALVAALALAAGASAATLTDSGGVLTFTAGAGAADSTSIQAMGSAIRFSGSGETVSASGCTVVTAGSVFDCSGVTRVVVDLGDRDDSFTSDVASAISLTVQGGDGNDFLQGSDSTGDTIDGGNGGTRLLCEDTTAPYSCVYSPRGDEGGLRTLEAVAIDGAQQATTALKSVTVGRFTPLLSLSVSPSSDRKPPLHFRAHGSLTLPSSMTHSIGCSTGTVAVKIEAGAKTVSTRHIELEHDCTYSSSIAFHSRSSFGKATVLHLSARFGGSAVLTAASAKRRSARIR